MKSVKGVVEGCTMNRFKLFYLDMRQGRGLVFLEKKSNFHLNLKCKNLVRQKGGKGVDVSLKLPLLKVKKRCATVMPTDEPLK